mgnify:CR=1 FL=1
MDVPCRAGRSSKILIHDKKNSAADNARAENQENKRSYAVNESAPTFKRYFSAKA